MTNTAPTISTPAHLQAFFARVNPVRSRLIFALDATASRQRTWDTAARLQAEMFETVTAIGGLDIQLVYFRGFKECVASRWLSDPKALAQIMSQIQCASGHTQIGRVLSHACKETQREKVSALILIGDACEEIPATIFTEARSLSSVPVFLFQEGTDDQAAGIFAEIARITGGA